MRQSSIDQIIEDLYAGTLDSGAWDRAIISIADLIKSSGAFLFSVNPATAVILRDEIHRLDPEVVRAYRKDWVSRDVRLHAAMQAPIGEPTFERQMDLTEKWEGTEIYNDFLLRHDTPYLLATWLHKAPDKLVVLSFQGSSRHGSFSESDARKIKPLMPHVRRSLEIRDRLEAEKVRASTLSSAIGGLQFGLFVLDGKGCILDASGISEQLLRREPAIRREKDRTLWLREPAGSQLRNLVRTGKTSKNSSSGMFAVPRGRGLPNLSVVVVAMPGVPMAWTGADPCWLVFIFDPDRRLNPTVEIVSRDLGISEREAQIAALLAMGDDILRISQRLGITVHTARSHLKHIFDKTGVRSQSDLIRRILTGPAAYMAKASL